MPSFLSLELETSSHSKCSYLNLRGIVVGVLRFYSRTSAYKIIDKQVYIYIYIHIYIHIYIYIHVYMYVCRYACLHV